ncbi:hypothetical protein HIM_10354 [Hirsutella minnesotensis 3608]|uniref:Uncharacterized protein n=1 Tax=Hirsutella minnesotensis 3608 TaxID=1043627 RepID=A0A0F7ZRV5_9HYPO|nr:hypothetical protein HIM_10354 [Hirsutella minnesotensis 3608]
MDFEEKWLEPTSQQELLMKDFSTCSTCSSRAMGFSKSQGLGTKKTLHFSLTVLKDLFLVALAITGLVSLLGSSGNACSAHVTDTLSPMHNAHKSHHPNSCDCGNSTAEAISLGCKYDSLAAAWLPEHCRDDELTVEFERSGPGENGTWIYWADTAHSIEIGVEEIAKMADSPDLRFHMSSHWHVIHCIFYWRKQYRARFNGKIVEPRSDTEEHIKHCGKIFQDPGYGTVAGVPFNTDKE